MIDTELPIRRFSDQPEHNPHEYTDVTPSVVERLVRSGLLVRISPAQPFAADLGYTASVILKVRTK